MKNIIAAIVITAGVCIPFSFLAGTLCFGGHLKRIESVHRSCKDEIVATKELCRDELEKMHRSIDTIPRIEGKTLPDTIHFKKLTADCIQLVDEKGRSRIELFCNNCPETVYSSLSFIDYVGTDHMIKMSLYSMGNYQAAGIHIDSPPGKSLYDFKLDCIDVLGPMIEMHYNDMFELELSPCKIDMNVYDETMMRIEPFGISKKD